GNTYLREPGAQRALAGDERRPPRCAALLGIIVGKHHAFTRDAVDVGRAVAHQPERVGADVGLPDVVTEYDKDVRPLTRRGRRWRRSLLGLRRLDRRTHCQGRRRRQCRSSEQNIPTTDVGGALLVDFFGHNSLPAKTGVAPTRPAPL